MSIPKLHQNYTTVCLLCATSPCQPIVCEKSPEKPEKAYRNIFIYSARIKGVPTAWAESDFDLNVLKTVPQEQKAELIKWARKNADNVFVGANGGLS